MLHKAVERTIRHVAGSNFYIGNSVGIVIVEGPCVMDDPKLKAVSTAAIWLEQGERTCIKRLLQREQRWFPPAHQDPQEYIDGLLVANDCKMKNGG